MSDRGPSTTTRWTPPKVLPYTWRVRETAIDGGTWTTPDMSIIASCSTERDGREWVHVSVARRDRVPNWRELSEVKRVMLGDREAYQVFPPKDRYVNTHPYCLHLFACLDGPQLPDFRVSVEENQL